MQTVMSYLTTAPMRTELALFADGLTSVDLGSYVLGSWLGMLPGDFSFLFFIPRLFLFFPKLRPSSLHWLVALPPIC